MKNKTTKSPEKIPRKSKPRNVSGNSKITEKVQDNKSQITVP